jgi:hypothetical protein
MTVWSMCTVLANLWHECPVYKLKEGKPDYELISNEATYLSAKLCRHFNLIELERFLPVKLHFRSIHSQLCLFKTVMCQHFITTE